MQGMRLKWNDWMVFASFAVMLTTSHECHAGQVYECRVNGQRVFSDQVCAADAVQREVTPVNTMNARDAAIGYRASPTHKDATQKNSSTRNAQADDARDKRQERCLKLSNAKQDINSRLRAGYSGAQGERLRDRLRKVDSDYYDLRCSSLR